MSSIFKNILKKVSIEFPSNNTIRPVVQSIAGYKRYILWQNFHTKYCFPLDPKKEFSLSIYLCQSIYILGWMSDDTTTLERKLLSSSDFRKTVSFLTKKPVNFEWEKHLQWPPYSDPLTINSWKPKSIEIAQEMLKRARLKLLSEHCSPFFCSQTAHLFFGFSGKFWTITNRILKLFDLFVTQIQASRFCSIQKPMELHSNWKERWVCLCFAPVVLMIILNTFSHVIKSSRNTMLVGQVDRRVYKKSE